MAAVHLQYIRLSCKNGNLTSYKGAYSTKSLVEHSMISIFRIPISRPPAKNFRPAPCISLKKDKTYVRQLCYHLPRIIDARSPNNIKTSTFFSNEPYHFHVWAPKNCGHSTRCNYCVKRDPYMKLPAVNPPAAAYPAAWDILKSKLTCVA